MTIDTELCVLKEASTRSDSVTEPERGVRGLGVGGWRGRDRNKLLGWTKKAKVNMSHAMIALNVTPLC